MIHGEKHVASYNARYISKLLEEEEEEEEDTFILKVALTLW